MIMSLQVAAERMLQLCDKETRHIESLEGQNNQLTSSNSSLKHEVSEGVKDRKLIQKACQLIQHDVKALARDAGMITVCAFRLNTHTS